MNCDFNSHNLFQALAPQTSAQAETQVKQKRMFYQTELNTVREASPNSMSSVKGRTEGVFIKACRTLYIFVATLFLGSFTRRIAEDGCNESYDVAIAGVYTHAKPCYL